MRRCSPLPSRWHRYFITTFDARSSGPHRCTNSNCAFASASSGVSRPLLSARSISMLFCFYLYPHASAPLRAQCFRNWLSVVSLAVPLLLLSQKCSWCVPKMCLHPVCWPFSVCYSIFTRRFGGGIPAARWQPPCSKLSDRCEVKLTKRSTSAIAFPFYTADDSM